VQSIFNSFNDLTRYSIENFGIRLLLMPITFYAGEMSEGNLNMNKISYYTNGILTYRSNLREIMAFFNRSSQ
jgi:hypothetical protein